MKKSVLLFILVLLVVILPIQALAAANYVSLNAGGNWLVDADVDVSGEDAGELVFDGGYTAAAAFGRLFDNGLRTELEVAYRINDIDKFETSNGMSFDGENEDVETWAGMANVYYEYAYDQKIKPFVGVGVGYANVDLGDYDDDLLAYQAMIGVGVEVRPNLMFDVQYRFMNTDDPEYSVCGVDIESEYRSFGVTAGLRYMY